MTKKRRGEDKGIYGEFADDLEDSYDALWEFLKAQWAVEEGLDVDALYAGGVGDAQTE